MAHKEDIVIDEGSRFVWNIKVLNQSLAGLTARMQIRRSPGTPVLFDVSEYLSVDAAANLVRVDIPGSATVAATWQYGTYDIEIYNAASTAFSPVRVIQGDVRLDREVTI